MAKSRKRRLEEKSSSTNMLFPPLKNDYSTDKEESLEIDYSRFKSDSSSQEESEITGLKYKTTKTLDTFKSFFLFHRSEVQENIEGDEELDDNTEMQVILGESHAPAEYFAMQVLIRLGIVAAKCRITTDKDGIPMIASRAFEPYLPMAGVRAEVAISPEAQPHLHRIRCKYKFDIEKQLLRDLEEKKDYKVSGNTFGTDVAALLLGDFDLQPDCENLGLIRYGNRFYCAAIDKEKAVFAGYDYKTLDKIVNSGNVPVAKDALYKFRLLDQELAVVNQIDSALVVTDSQCDFDRIFRNKRVLRTPLLAKVSEIYCTNLKTSAQSLLDHYKTKLGENYLTEFAVREKYRATIADQICRGLSLPSEAMKVVIEDLRAPYYQEFFVNKKYITEADCKNEKLLDMLAQDFKAEFTLEPDKLSKKFGK
ncbi:MAG: hypothetical protein ABI597_06845 [Gammaproteobacteria bacterium]